MEIDPFYHLLMTYKYYCTIFIINNQLTVMPTTKMLDLKFPLITYSVDSGGFPLQVTIRRRR